jgi:formate dehydrogenase iron-sulfur subunit
MAKGMLFDSTMCVGCRECESACAQKWGLPYDEKIAQEERLSAHKLTTVQTFGEQFSRKLCMGCADPGCASACPVAALQKTSLGPVTYNESRCIGCRYCMVACAFQVPTYEWQKRQPLVRKCDNCYERQLGGKPTACSEACPTGATISGEMDAMLAEARKRLAEKPDDYNGKIYGLSEVGGTSVLMLAKTPFEKLGMRTDLPQKALPPITGAALSAVPDVVAVGATLLGGIYWISHRREAVAREEGGRS